ncbi:MAG: hypothetical protein ONB24_08010, partial [candidate division KSB1 bacterium]|nr:hypothetical protein [candidate division KSB1 bacterium]
TGFERNTGCERTIANIRNTQSIFRKHQINAEMSKRVSCTAVFISDRDDIGTDERLAVDCVAYFTL